MHVKNNDYENLKIQTLKIPRNFNKYMILKFLQTYTTSGKTNIIYDKIKERTSDNKEKIINKRNTQGNVQFLVG